MVDTQAVESGQFIGPYFKDIVVNMLVSEEEVEWDAINGTIELVKPNQKFLQQLMDMKRSTEEMRSEMRRETLGLRRWVEVLSQEHPTIPKVVLMPNNVRERG